MKKLWEIVNSEVGDSYKGLPFWSWNDKLNTEKLKKQINWMKENDIGGYFMHARSGLQTEYMSEEWMQCIEACAEEGEKTGMKSWIYDENGWPSGFAGGKLLEEEGNRDKYIVAKTGRADESATVCYRVTEDKLVRVNAADEKKSSDEFLNIFINTAVSTADILNPDVVDKFIALTHEQYKERFGDDFAEKIEGFFTDEPQYQRWDTPYTDMMAGYFKEKFDEDILDSIGLLFVEKEGYLEFRYRYWKGMQELMLKNFSQKIYEWCEDNNVKLTGHYVEESALGAQMMCCAGVMPFYEYEHIPGIDWLGKSTATELAAVQVSSASEQLGKKHVLTETFGCCGWDVTPAELKRIAGFQYVHGVNMMCHHLVPYSERGNRKYDYPAHYSEVNPWVRKEYKTFNTYFNRLGTLLGEGEHKVNVAMLHPIRSTYFNYKRTREMEEFDVPELERGIVYANKLLGRRGVAYHYLDETLLAKYGFVDGEKIGCGKCAYDYLVIPKVYTMDKTTEELINKYVENGGKVLMLDEKPTYVEATPYDYDYLSSNCTLEDIINAQPFKVKNPDADIYSTYRKLEGKEYLYIINGSESETYTQEYVFDGDIKSFTKVDLADLSEKQVPLTITLKPGEDALLFFNNEECEEAEELVPYELRFENAQITYENNAMPVDFVAYSEDGINYSKPWPAPALFQKLIKEKYEGNLFLKYEFNVEKIPEKILLKAEENNEIHAWLNGELLTEKLDEETGYENVYDISSKVREGVNEYVAEVKWHEDESVHFALFGENVTESLKNCVVYDSELQPIFLIGKFGVYTKTGYEETEPGYVVAKNFYIGEEPKAVSEFVMEGFPFLAGEVTLSGKVNLDSKNVLLKLAGDYQMAEVTINGTKLKNLLFERETDISSVAVCGENDISVTFMVSNRNMMGPHHVVGSKTQNVHPGLYDFSGLWNEDVSDSYHDGYDLKKFYK